LVEIQRPLVQSIHPQTGLKGFFLFLSCRRVKFCFQIEACGYPAVSRYEVIGSCM